MGCGASAKSKVDIQKGSKYVFQNKDKRLLNCYSLKPPPNGEIVKVESIALGNAAWRFEVQHIASGKTFKCVKEDLSEIGPGAEEAVKKAEEVLAVQKAKDDKVAQAAALETSLQEERTKLPIGMFVVALEVQKLGDKTVPVGSVGTIASHSCDYDVDWPEAPAGLTFANQMEEKDAKLHDKVTASQEIKYGSGTVQKGSVGIVTKKRLKPGVKWNEEMFNLGTTMSAIKPATVADRRKADPEFDKKEKEREANEAAAAAKARQEAQEKAEKEAKEKEAKEAAMALKLPWGVWQNSKNENDVIKVIKIQDKSRSANIELIGISGAVKSLGNISGTSGIDPQTMDVWVRWTGKLSSISTKIKGDGKMYNSDNTVWIRQVKWEPSELTSYKDASGTGWEFRVKPNLFEIRCNDKPQHGFSQNNAPDIIFDLAGGNVLVEKIVLGRPKLEQKHAMGSKFAEHFCESLKAGGWAFSEDVKAHADAKEKKNQAKMDRAKASLAEVSEAWKNEVLEAHNDLRASRGAPPVAWSDECYIYAKMQVDDCEFHNSRFRGYLDGPSGRHGQNVSVLFGEANETAYKIVSRWMPYGYAYDKEGPSERTMEFTQAVWKSTTHVGMVHSKDKQWMVANYLPAGNQEGKFKANVGRDAEFDAEEAERERLLDRNAGAGTDQAGCALAAAAMRK
mmetsp:Transcript_40893/g.73447  ORF Transcript_40893/g.73447 Transcript_40893/m.73447 type:complete len:679 (+) Transcript_40893:68-2104(+)